MEITLRSRKLGKTFTFYKASGGSAHVFDSTDKPGNLGKQICARGYYGGLTLTATDENFERVCRRWLKAYVARDL